jgi:hypothetical protein
MLSRWLKILILLTGLPLASWGQADPIPSAFKLLFQRLQQAPFKNAFGKPITFSPVGVYHDSVYMPGNRWKLNFELRFASKPLALQRRVVEITENGYPVSYSVVFQNCLVALFKDGKFGCYRLPDLIPDKQLTRRLNTGSWQRFWLIDGKLVAQNSQGTSAYDVNSRAWQPYTQPVPFGQRPKLYEDARFLVYATCDKDFGIAGHGAALFYKKATGQTFSFYATCPTSMWEEAGQYSLLWSNGRTNGYTGRTLISNPELYRQVSGPRAPRSTTSQATPVITHALSFESLQLLGGLRWQEQTLYLVHWHNTTFLATIDGSRITIVDPLFSGDLFPDNPITTNYSSGVALTNLGDNNLGQSSERATLLWQGQQLIKIEWGQQP